MNSFEENGFLRLKQVYPSRKLEEINQAIMMNIQQCADELECSLEDYLTNVSRWLSPSPVTNSMTGLVESHLKNIASDFSGQEVELAKVNIISKTAYARAPVPCHQDIAYSREAPYEFSLWLPLQDVSLTEGVLEFLPKSHLDPIEPAVDFWQPNFIDTMYLSSRWQKGFVALPVQRGEAIVFDSRVWHRSAANLSGCNRFAMVTRWRGVNYFPNVEIPQKIPAQFGMWTAGDITTSILQQGLATYFNLKVAGLEDCLQCWQEKLIQEKQLPFLFNVVQAKKALNSLWILHKATHLHNGGDAQGLVYPNLWHHLLNPLMQWLKIYCKKREYQND